MGANIGQVVSSSVVQRPSNETLSAQGFARPPVNVRAEEAPSTSNSASAPPFPESSTATFRVGFGEGTVSSIGAALDVLGRSVRSVRDATPTLVEIQSDVRARLVEARLAVQGEVSPVLTVRPDRDVESSVDFQVRNDAEPQILNGVGLAVGSQIPEPSAQVPQFAATSVEPAIVPLASTDTLEERDAVELERAQAEPPPPSGPENVAPRLDVLA